MLPQPEEIARRDTCLVWRCGKPLHDAQGKPLGKRGMCWKHLKQAQREGILVPASQIEKIKPPCSECRERASKWLGLCRSCYNRQWRQNTPGRERMLAREREQSRRRRHPTQQAT